MNVAIVGLSGTGHDAPWTDPAWEVWGLNGAHTSRMFWPRGELRADAWFQIHPPEACNGAELDWLRALEAGEVPAVTTYVRGEDLAEWTRRFPSVAARHLLAAYPLDAVKARFPHGWFANTFCLEIALALLLGAERLGLYGVDCGAFGRELAVERPAVAYWIGVAHALGVAVDLPEVRTLLYEPVYGFDYWPEARRAAELTQLLLDGHERLDAENLDTIAAVDAAEDEAATTRQ